MEKEKAKELSDILKAYSEGKTIQKQALDGWYDISETYFKYVIKDFDRRVLRIKPEKKLVPFTFEDNNLFKDKWVKYKGKTFLKRVITVMSDRIIIFGNDKYNECDFIHVSYEKLLSDYEFEDKSPCGKYIEE